MELGKNSLPSFGDGPLLHSMVPLRHIFLKHMSMYCSKKTKKQMCVYRYYHLDDLQQ